ncbi:MAG: adenylosuccinate lyase [Prolixibacteraceae bacterium]|jgi:adenylosuccinate lyase|nr:adenylosuccinate lyase [Prolixibacteraceae bacterium]NLO04138.1 adenylosuccinate lyase [Bacteroidales bacterium]
MDLNTLTAISPVDGRYRDKVEGLMNYFSEYALIKYRVLTEVEYFLALCELPLSQLAGISHKQKKELQKLYLNFTPEDAKRVKEIERITNHDVKAVEYYLKEEFKRIGLSSYIEFIHFGLTSQDANNTAIPKSIHDALDNEYFPLLSQLTDKLEELATGWQEVPMLARTHGQPATPTKLGKEIRVFLERLYIQVEQLRAVRCYAKFGGATGNFNAHLVAYPNIDWQAFADKFCREKLGLVRSRYTTQIAHYDNYSAVFDALKRINNIILDLDRDMWSYISTNYFKQKIKKNEVGSSTMPHKVNPIDFENSEGNIGIANAGFAQLSEKLPVSRLQRDLTDSTVTRFIGVPFAHTVIAVKSTLKGLNKLVLNRDAIDADLENNWAVVAEAIQTILRRELFPNPYEALKDLTRNNEVINKEQIHKFIDSLNVGEEVKDELKKITPQNYTGVF